MILVTVYYISFSSSNTQFYESKIFCLFSFWVFFPDKSFKLISKYTQKCQNNSLYQKEKKNTLEHLKLGKVKFGIRKIGCSMSWTRYKLFSISILNSRPDMSDNLKLHPINWIQPLHTKCQYTFNYLSTIYLLRSMLNYNVQMPHLSIFNE